MNSTSALHATRRRWKLYRQAKDARQEQKRAILSDNAFRAALEQLTEHLGVTAADALASAATYLDEMVAVNNDVLPDVNLVLSRIMHPRGYQNVLRYNEAVLEGLRSANETSSLVLLTSHRSYADFVARIPFALHGFPREYRFAGANTNVWPIGPILHYTGMIFVRRGFQDPLYSLTLRQYVGWLTQRRANFFWAIEGTRSRTGKLHAPKEGLLAYLADAYANGDAPDLALVPAAVVYEYLDEVYEFARYGRGAAKPAENLRFAVRLVRQQRRVPHHARVHIGIGEPVSLARFCERDADAATLSAGVSAAAREVCRRIDAVTPITSVALALVALLERDGVAVTHADLVATLEPVVDYIKTRGLPAAESSLGDADSMSHALDLLTAQKLVITTGGHGEGCRHSVTPGRHLEAAHYRNAVVHFFAIRSMVEIGLVRSQNAAAGHRVAAFWDGIATLRELLAGEFFFPDGVAFTNTVYTEVAACCPDWQAQLDSHRPQAVQDQLRPYFAPRMLAPFLEAHKIVADGLLRLGQEPVTGERHFLLDCLAHAELELRLARMHRPDVASLNMFEVPLRAADSRGLLAGQSRTARQAYCAAIDESLDVVAELEAADTADAPRVSSQVFIRRST